MTLPDRFVPVDEEALNHLLGMDRLAPVINPVPDAAHGSTPALDASPGTGAGLAANGLPGDHLPDPPAPFHGLGLGIGLDGEVDHLGLAGHDSGMMMHGDDLPDPPESFESFDDDGLDLP